MNRSPLERATPAARWPFVPTLTDYRELTGMFTHAAGVIRNDAGTPIAQWAWGHEAAPPGESDLHWWSLAGTPAYSNYERFRVDGPWIRLVGWSTPTETGPVFLSTRATTTGQAQPYALVNADAPYDINVAADLVAPDGSVVASYTDYLLWAPTPDGWTQQEIFRWTEDFGAGCAVHTHSVWKPRQMFARNLRTTIDWNGKAVNLEPDGTVVTWTW